MKLTGYQVSKIEKKIPFSETRNIILIDVIGDTNLVNGSSEVRFNIYCIDSNYNIIWQVSEKGECTFPDGDPFCYLGKNSKDEIIADRFSGFTYKINLDTGEAVRTGFHK